MRNSDDYRDRFTVKPMTATAQNTRAVTAKQLIEATQRGKYGGRYVLNNSQLYTVRLCGMVVSIDQHETHTDFAFYDGTGTLKGRTWPKNISGETELTGAMINSYYEVISNVVKDGNNILLQTIKIKRLLTQIMNDNCSKVKDHNNITLHMLTAIHEDCTLGRLKNQDLERWQKAEHTTSRSIRTSLSLQIDKEAIHSLLSTETIRGSDIGASSIYIIQNLHMDEHSTKEALDKMIEEGSIYNTINYNHYKLADDN